MDLGGILGFPKIGYGKQTAVLKGYGYVFYNEYSDEGNGRSKEILSRLFIEDEITDKSGNILGYRALYENPYYGKDQEIKLPKDEISFKGDGGSDTLLFTDGEPMIIECKSSASWCRAYGKKREDAPSYGEFPCKIGVVIEAGKSDTVGVSTAMVEVKTKYGKEKTIKVTREAAMPRLSFYEDESEDKSIPVKGCAWNIRLDTNIPFEDIEIDNTASEWCDAKLDTKSIDYDKYNVLSLNAKPNNSGKNRSGTITLKYKKGSESLTLNVKQDKPYIKCDYYSMETPYNVSGYSGYSKDIVFGSNVTNMYDFEIKSSTDWINELSISDYGYYPGDYYRRYYLSFHHDRNYTGSDREGVITISDKSGNLLHSIKVVQRHN